MGKGGACIGREEAVSLGIEAPSTYFVSTGSNIILDRLYFA